MRVLKSITAKFRRIMELLNKTGNKPENRERPQGKLGTGKTGYGLKTISHHRNGLNRKTVQTVKQFKP